MSISHFYFAISLRSLLLCGKKPVSRKVVKHAKNKKNHKCVIRLNLPSLNPITKIIRNVRYHVFLIRVTFKSQVMFMNGISRRVRVFFVIFAFVVSAALIVNAQGKRSLSGVVVSTQFELVPNLTFDVETASGSISVTTDTEGSFSVQVPEGEIVVKSTGRHVTAFEQKFSPSDRIDDLRIKISYVIPPIAESVTINAEALTPDIEFRNDAIYKNSLFNRDDQLIFTLNAGINAGQHQGGGDEQERTRKGNPSNHVRQN